jgi:tetratricopeptide (TPR) repeat protein
MARSRPDSEGRGVPAPPASSGTKRGARVAALAALAVLLVYLAIHELAAHTIRKANPDLALRLAPSNSAVLVSTLEDRLMSGGRGSELRPLAEKALRRDPLNTSAWRALGLIEASRGNIPLATKIISFANFLSRRDNATNIWLITQHLQRNDLPRALESYDYALSTSLSLREQLIPRLALATAEAEIIPPLAATLLRSPGWADDLFAAMINYAPDGRNAADLIARLQAGRYEGSYALLRGLPKRFVLLNQVPAAHRIYRQLTHDRPSDTGVLAFSVLEPIEPFDWQLAAENGLDATALSDEAANGGVLSIRADPERVGTAAKRLLTLGPGEYRLDTPAVTGTGPAPSSLQWIVSCHGSTGQLATASLRVSASPQTLRFRVPTQGCGAQWLSLRISTGSSHSATEIEMRSPSLRRAKA